MSIDLLSGVFHLLLHIGVNDQITIHRDMLSSHMIMKFVLILIFTSIIVLIDGITTSIDGVL